MFDEIRKNFVGHIKAVVPDDMPEHEFKEYDGDLLTGTKTGASDRRFSVLPADGITDLLGLSASGKARYQKTFLVLVQYIPGKSLNDFVDRLHLDVDRLVWTLKQVGSYGSGDDWALLSRLPGEQFFVDFDDQSLSALVTIPFEVIYTVTYS